MGDFKLTEAQQKVVDAADCSLLVAAAAGSGKTAVLVKRIIERIKNGRTSLDRLLIVTFTNAAAAEMKERIGKALHEEAAKYPDNKIYREQAALLPEAKISTIDSFCNSIVKENFQALGIDPGFSVMEPAENELILSDVLEEIFEEEYTDADADFLTLVASYGAYKDDEPVRKLVTDLYDFADNEMRPEEWLKNCLSEYDCPDRSELYEEITEEFRASVRDVIKLCEYCLEICNAGCPSAADNFVEDLVRLNELLKDSTDYDGAVKALSKLSFEKFTSGRKLPDEEKSIKDKAKNIRDKYKTLLDNYADVWFSVSREDADKLFDLTRPAVSALVRLTLKISERVWEAKKEKNSFSFSDIEHMAFGILCTRDENGNEAPTAFAAELADRYDEIMIDEYQDSSYIQEYMLKSISGEYGDRTPNLFMVGDVKQSIYSFRQARPELFSGKYRDFKDEGTHRKIDLSENFRSRRNVLDAVNVLLAPVMKADMTEIEYDGAAALHFGSKDYNEDDPVKPVYDTEVILIDKELSDCAEEAAEGEDEPEESVDEGQTNEAEREALTVAKKIREMIDSGFMITDGKTADGEIKFRPVRLSDFAILTRNGKKVSETFVRELEKMSIPAVADTGTGFFDAVEVQKTLAFLRILDNPYDDVSFAAALYSGYGHFTASDLAELKIRYGASDKPKKKKMLYECMKEAYSDDEERTDSLTGKIHEFMDLLVSMRKQNETLTVHELIDEFYKESGYKDTVTEMPRGEGRRGNLDILVSLAEKYEKSSFAGLHDFIRYIDRLLEKKSDFGEAESDSGEEAVTVTTMHKSKGLEYPIVFACRLSKQFNSRDSKLNVMLDRDKGIASNYVDRKKRVKCKTVKQVFLQDKEKRKALSEELRVLYVALTRAKEKLFIVATEEKPADVMKKWHDALLVGESPVYTDLKGYDTFMDFIGPTLFHGLSEEDIEAIDAGETKNIKITRHAGEEAYTAGFGISMYRYDAESAAELAHGKAPATLEKSKTEAYKSIMELPGVREEIKAQEEYVYPELSKTAAPMRVSVSALKHIEIANLMSAEEKEENDPPVMPGLIRDGDKEEVSKGALRGTLYHEVFEKLRYDGVYSALEDAEQSVIKDIEELIRDGFIEADILDTVRVRDIAVFCMSDIGKRMIEAQRNNRLHREQPFVYGLSSDEYRYYSKTTDDTDMVMVQGIIDAYIEENDGIVLVDYKTDKVGKDAVRELTDKYRVQLELYAKALAKLTSKPVKQKIIYSVTAGKEIILES